MERESKRCRKCQDVFPLGAFTLTSPSNGLDSQCLDCREETNRELVKLCRKCGRVLPVEMFYVKATPDGLDSQCRRCRALTQRLWRAAHLEAIRLREQTYRAQKITRYEAVRRQRLAERTTSQPR